MARMDNPESAGKGAELGKNAGPEAPVSEGGKPFKNG
jgi:hypothetical protein